MNPIKPERQGGGSLGLSLPALALGISAAALAGSFYGEAGAQPARSRLLLGLVGAAGLAALSFIVSAAARRLGLFRGRGPAARLAVWAYFAWFAAELAGAVLTAQRVCREHFGSNALIAALPLLLLAVWQMDAAALDRAARALWWLAAAGAAVCLAGLWGQMEWAGLYAGEAPPLWQGGLPRLAVYPEYFALPFLCGEKKAGRGALLPFWSCAVGAGYAFALELVLGRAGGPGYTGLELLRAWSLGYFSRLDALLLLVWLAGALWRVCLLGLALRELARRGLGRGELPPGPPALAGEHDCERKTS